MTTCIYGNELRKENLSVRKINRRRKMSKPTNWFISGPSACAYVHKREHIEPLITALAQITGDDNEDYTATLIEDEKDSSGYFTQPPNCDGSYAN